eukprot:CAMPEP_0168572544 /NCGR_PEP_ID=MMETSP0413-20121227/18004_1 /TAXON_ID=136452 /ORGANISM="Filamoeba nolandi, Strain NC-AS-23-1" /LENGTH=312 /DNA_ID=CAMNT_0008605627 /DNA_START=236 /DNA_END=1171 /DNA_ORIENTATION=+
MSKKVRKHFLGSYRKLEPTPSPPAATTIFAAPPLLTPFEGENPWETIDFILTQQWQIMHEPHPVPQPPQQPQEQQSLSISPQTTPLSQSPQNENTGIAIPEPTNRTSSNYAMLPTVQNSPKTTNAEGILFQPTSSDNRSDGNRSDGNRSDGKTNYSSVTVNPEDIPPPLQAEDRSRSPAPSQKELQRRSKSPEIDMKKTRASIRIAHPDHFAFWINFLTCANFTQDESMEIALILVDNELGEAEVPELDHELLKSMGIVVAKTRIRILKMKEAWLQGKKNEKKELQRRSKSPEIDMKKTRASIRIAHPDHFA